MTSQTLDKFKSYFENLDNSKVNSLKDIYSFDILFQDPVHKIEGLDNLERYFSKLNSNLENGKFKFTSEYVIENKAILEWEMVLATKRPRANVTAQGISILSIKDNKVTSHRDYFDVGEVFYENIPVIGGILRLIKRRIGLTTI